MKCIRKFTPVSPYDIQGLESWLEDQSLRGLFLVKFGTTFSIFAQGVPKRTRYRVEYCKPYYTDEPPQDLLDLYRDFGWEFVCWAGNIDLPIFRTQDPQTEEPHTDPSLQGTLLEKVAERLKRAFLHDAILLLAVFSLMLAAGLALSVISYPVLLAVIVYGAVQTFTRCRSWLRVRAVVRSLQDGVPMNHKISYPNRIRSNLAQFVLLLLFLALLLLHYYFNNAPAQNTQEDFSPILLSELEGRSDSVAVINCPHLLSLCYSQWEVIQIQTFGVEGGRTDWVRMDVDWYRPLIPALAEPLARDLLRTSIWLDGLGSSWWTAPIADRDGWTVTEYKLDSVDWCAIAVHEESGLQAAAVCANGQAARARYTGSANLADHLEEIAGMVRETGAANS